MNIVQVAISSLDVQRSFEWYSQGLGYVSAGDRHPTASMEDVQGVADARVADLLWLVDRQEFFQLELFSYASPEVRPLRPDHRPCDHGYTRVGVWVADFDEVLRTLATLGTLPLTAPLGRPGARRVCVRDPDGIYVELMEDQVPTPQGAAPVRPGVAAATRSVTASVADLDVSLRYFVDTLGMREVTDTVLHTDEHEAIWGLPGADLRRTLLAAGNVWLELVHYLDPPGRPRPDDYRLTDQGILNIAIGSRTLAGFQNTRDAAVAAGYRVFTEIERDQLHVQYTVDEQGFSVEMAYFDEELDATQGFLPIA